MALPLPVVTPEQEAYRLAPHRIRRCTFRRIIHLEGAVERVYDVECLYPDRRVPLPLGDLDSATPICNACTAPHIFRPDED
jgi:NAD-dependent SIR2 family protein deacetylase